MKEEVMSWKNLSGCRISMETRVIDDITLSSSSVWESLEKGRGARASCGGQMYRISAMCSRILCGLLVLLLATALQAADQPRIEGVVLDSKGRPLANASVYVYTAKPREGEATMCPTCYPDCGKKARTDANGQFVIEQVNGDLLYRLLVVAKGFRPDYIKDADPLFGSTELRLKTHKWPEAAEEHKVTGKIIDPDGKPVGGAVIEVQGSRYGVYSYSSATGRAESLGATDENGEFLIHCTNDLAAITVSLNARGLAKKRLWLEPGKAHLIRLKRGVEVTGRLLRDGNPVPGVNISMNTEERESSVFLRGFDATTGPDGIFRIPNVPANTKFYLYTRMKDMAKLGVALAPQLVSTGADETVLKLQEIIVRPAHTLRGKVVVANDKPLPPNTRLNVSLENGYDNQQVTLGEDGSFEFKGLPADSVSLSLRVRGYRISAKNPSKDWLNEGLIVGKLQGDMDNFIIHLEPGDRFDRGEGPAQGEERQPTNKPLRGAKL
jgi:hypothetical protein